jgi:energy-coupling factor transporter ATP-binding protein EcfA2
MFVETINTIGTLTNAHDIAKKSLPILVRLTRAIKNHQLKVLICGYSGTGKSTLGKLLSGEFGRDDILQPYQISLRAENLELDSTTRGSITVLPGQPSLPGQAGFWNNAFREVSSNKFNLVINVVAYGYHSISQTDYQNLPSYQPGITIQQFLDDYSQVRREKELEVLSQLLPHLSIANNNQVVMLTLVTKQDLWWPQRQQVREHYQTGVDSIYNKSIQEIQNTLGKSNFVHEYISASLLTKNFAVGNGEVLVPVAEGYDQATQIMNFDRVLNFIENSFEIEIGG